MVTLPSVLMPARLKVVWTLASDAALHTGVVPPKTVVLRSPALRAPTWATLIVPARQPALQAAARRRPEMWERTIITSTDATRQDRPPTEGGFRRASITGLGNRGGRLRQFFGRFLEVA
jgi:hypothetical protein